MSIDTTYELFNDDVISETSFLLSATCSSKDTGKWSLIWRVTWLDIWRFISVLIFFKICGLCVVIFSLLFGISRVPLSALVHVDLLHIIHYLAPNLSLHGTLHFFYVLV